jgi:[ribosomal protein S5]-alanine N-acetyltransferase
MNGEDPLCLKRKIQSTPASRAWIISLLAFGIYDRRTPKIRQKDSRFPEEQSLKKILEVPSKRRRAEFLAAVKRSRKLHAHWASPPRTAKAFNKNLERFGSKSHVGYWVLTESGELAGAININEIVQGSFRSGYLGYYAFAPHNGRGYMTKGLRAVVSLAFRKLRLHRLEANIQPKNEPSRRLVKRLGFKLEGFSPRYLKVAGKWRDHERWAVTAEDWTN